MLVTKLPLRTWVKVGSRNLLGCGIVAYSPDKSLSLIRPTFKEILANSPLYLRLDTTARSGNVLRAYTEDEYFKYWTDKFVQSFEQMAEPDVLSTIYNAQEIAVNSYKIRCGTLYEVAEDLYKQAQKEVKSPAQMFFDFMLSNTRVTYRDPNPNIPYTEDDYVLPPDHSSYRTATLVQRILLAYQYGLPVNSHDLRGIHGQLSSMQDGLSSYTKVKF